MSKILIAGLASLLIGASSTAYAQAPSAAGQIQGVPSQADLKAFTDWRIDVVKSALQLSPEQAKLWPPVEAAIRARANARQARLAKLAAQISSGTEQNVVDVLSERADALAQRAATLKQLTEAWRPLYASLDDRQKLRLQFLAAYVLREMRGAAQARAMQFDEEEYYE